MRPDQLDLLRQIEDLGRASEHSSVLEPRVSAIFESLQLLEDQARYDRLIDAADPNDVIFIKLSRRRLIRAQQEALANYERLQLFMTRRKVKQPSETQGTDYRTAQPSSETAVHGTNQSADSLEQSLRESRSEDITNVLKRMRDMAQGEVLKGELNISELDMSSRTLRELQEKYSGVDILLNGSRKLVKILDEADKWERRYMQASLGFLAFVMAYIVYRRILSGPIKLLLWGLLRFVWLGKLFIPKRSTELSAPSLPNTISESAVDQPKLMQPEITAVPESKNLWQEAADSQKIVPEVAPEVPEEVIDSVDEERSEQLPEKAETLNLTGFTEDASAERSEEESEVIPDEAPEKAEEVLAPDVHEVAPVEVAGETAEGAETVHDEL